MSDPVVFGFSFFHLFWSFFPWSVFLLFSPLAIHVRFCDTSICLSGFSLLLVLKRKGAQGWLGSECWRVYLRVGFFSIPLEGGCCAQSTQTLITQLIHLWLLIQFKTAVIYILYKSCTSDAEENHMALKQNQTKQNKKCPLGPLIPCQILCTLQENKGKLGKAKHS